MQDIVPRDFVREKGITIVTRIECFLDKNYSIFPLELPASRASLINIINIVLHFSVLIILPSILLY